MAQYTPKKAEVSTNHNSQKAKCTAIASHMIIATSTIFPYSYCLLLQPASTALYWIWQNASLSNFLSNCFHVAMNLVIFPPFINILFFSIL